MSTVLDPPAPPAPSSASERSIARRRPLPNGRAVAGALLVVLAAVGTFAAYLGASAPPTTTWLSATVELRPGQVLTAADVATFEAVAIELPPAQGDAVYSAGTADGLVGAIVMSPVRPGDLLTKSAAQAASTSEVGVSMSVPVAAERAFGGRVAPGERVDLLATIDSTTGVVARSIRVAAVQGGDGGLGGTSLVVTLLLPDLATAQEVLHASDTGELALTRGADPDEATSPATTDAAAGR